jgi:hypothetical protein
VALYQCLRGFPSLIRLNAFGVQADACHIRAAGAGGSTKMLDIIVLALGIGFFALSVGYAMACDQL